MAALVFLPFILHGCAQSINNFQRDHVVCYFTWLCSSVVLHGSGRLLFCLLFFYLLFTFYLFYHYFAFIFSVNFFTLAFALVTPSSILLRNIEILGKQKLTVSLGDQSLSVLS